MATGQENPGKFQAYDPSNPAPYQAPVMPEPVQAMPSPLPQQGPEINGAVKKSGAIATVADGILRGFMQGRAYHQAAQVMKLKKKSDDLQNSYNQDAVRLYQLTQAGVDPGSDSYKAAKSSVDGSWGALQDFYGQHIEQMNGEKKGKGKKNQPQLPPQAVLTNPNSTPYEKAQAWYQVAKQAGPPVYGQIAMLNTPEAQQRRKAQQQGTQNQVAGADLESAEISVKKAVTDAQGTVYKLGGQASEYEKIPEANRTPAQKEVVDQYNSARRIMDESQRRGTGAAHLYQSPDSKSQEYYTPGNEPEGWQPAQKAPTPTEEKRTDYDTAVKGGYKGSFEQWTAEETARGHRLGAPPKAGTGAGGGKGMEGSYQKALAYYKEEYPDMPEDERESLAHRKVEGAGQQQAGVIAHNAVSDPKQFDNDVLTAAIDRLRGLPQYKTMPTLDDALANIVGQGDNGYQYHNRGQVGKPDSHGKYSGGVTEDQLKNLERDLQTQIRAVVSGPKETALTPESRRAAASRMAPLFGPAAPTGSGTAPVSPQAAATPAPPASSPGGAGALPPEAVKHLRDGNITTFANGQQWTLRNGKPVQVGPERQETDRRRFPSHESKQAINPVLHEVLQEYPGLAKNFNAGNTSVVFATGKRAERGLKERGGLEFWSPTEAGMKDFPSPIPGKNVLEIYDDKLKSNPSLLKQAIYGDLMHGMGSDPYWSRLRNEFMQNFTPQELKRQERHDTWWDDVNGSKDRNGPTYDAYIRGWITNEGDGKKGQADSGNTMYSPKQIGLLKKMQDYLKTGKAER